ncbi:hypothetical protein, partial [Kocuria salsicia]|uniref:hypothetical protein n=1 Tax=Kocuria salsicia TaxID=664639 RepID=UPI001C92DBF7
GEEERESFGARLWGLGVRVARVWGLERGKEWKGRMEGVGGVVVVVRGGGGVDGGGNDEEGVWRSDGGGGEKG